VELKATIIAGTCLAVVQSLVGQSIQLPWSGFAHTPQHDGISMFPSQPLSRIKWTMQIGTGDNHFSSPVVTLSNTVIIPVKLTNAGFLIEALAGATGQTNWQQSTDYSAPQDANPYEGNAVCPLALTPKDRLYVAGAGGTVFYCDSPDSDAAPAFTRAAFYGLNQYVTNTNAFNSQVHICTPITSDRYGDIFFCFQAVGASPLGTQGGLARIDYNGSGSWISATNIIGSTHVFQLAVNCAPALSVDQKTIYIALTVTNPYGAWFEAIDSRTLSPLAAVALIDPETKSPSALDDLSTASPTIGPDGDVYFGVKRDTDDERGWLLHFDSSLTITKTPGLFGWDVTDSICKSSLVPSYQGNSSYLLATKYNNYGTGQYSMAILDPQQGVLDSQSGVTVMAAVLTIPSPVQKEWCVNSAAVDPFSKSVLANNEDGNLYRWDLTSNQLTESIALTTLQIGEAYTPTVIGVDGTVYAINHGVLFAIGQ
jgi:hypothetical protein